MTSRRAALVTIAAAGVAPALASDAPHTAHHHEPSAKPQAKDPVYFKKADFELLSCLTDLIIPRTETPGAADAGVPFEIDREVAGNKKLQRIFMDGFAWLNKQAASQHKNFLGLPESDQIAILTRASNSPATPGGKFFQTVKNMTIDTYYSTEKGLAQELGWRGNTYLSEFKGCTHPEHQT